MARPETDNANSQLTAYRCLLDNARAMLVTAREERWDDLAALDAERKDYLSRVIEADQVSTRPLDIEARTNLIQSILECDEQVRSLVRVRQNELSEMLGSMDNERKLADAYHGG